MGSYTPYIHSHTLFVVWGFSPVWVRDVLFEIVITVAALLKGISGVNYAVVWYEYERMLYDFRILLQVTCFLIKAWEKVIICVTKRW